MDGWMDESIRTIQFALQWIQISYAGWHKAINDIRNLTKMSRLEYVV
jgi:hypothetical protein